jgi:hypothetical protein
MVEILHSLAPDSRDSSKLLTDMLSKNIAFALISELFTRFLTLFDEKTGEKLDEKTAISHLTQDERDELNLIFHKYDQKDPQNLDLREIMALLFTGKTDGSIIPNIHPNFLPAGFWQLPLVSTILKDVITTAFCDILRQTCLDTFALPADWADASKKHPEGLYLSTDQQLDLIAPSISAELLLKCVTLEEDDEASTAEAVV